MGTKRKGGRPPKPAQFRRTHRLQLLLTAHEHEALTEYAARQEMTASEIIRGCLRALLRKEKAARGETQ